MDTVHAAAAAAALLLTAGCTSLPAPAPLIADPAGKALLAGEWTGEYYTPGTGRAGSIVFSFVTHDSLHCGYDGEHVHGDVLMVPPDPTLASRTTEGTPFQDELPDPSVIPFDEIRVSADQISGTLAPYRDPATGRALSTTFEGTIQGDRITGTFGTVDAATGIRNTGTWEVRRRAP